MNNMFVSNAASSALGAKRVAKVATPVADVHSEPVFDIPIVPDVAQPRTPCKYEKIEKMITHLQEDVRELQDIVKYFAEILTRFGEKLPDHEVCGGRTISDEIHAFDDIENVSDDNVSHDASDDNNDENDENDENENDDNEYFNDHDDDDDAQANDEEESGTTGVDIDVESN
jgi:hypothetical protein